MSKELKKIVKALSKIFRSILGIKEGTDVQATIEGIKKDISFFMSVSTASFLFYLKLFLQNRRGDTADQGLLSGSGGNNLNNS